MFNDKAVCHKCMHTACNGWCSDDMNVCTMDIHPAAVEISQARPVWETDGPKDGQDRTPFLENWYMTNETGSKTDLTWVFCVCCSKAGSRSWRQRMLNKKKAVIPRMRIIQPTQPSPPQACTRIHVSVDLNGVWEQDVQYKPSGHTQATLTAITVAYDYYYWLC